MSDHFTLEERLAQDSLFIQDFEISQCRLMNNAYFPWLLLIPKIPGACELVDLPFAEQQGILQEINLASHALRACFDFDKLNIATLGNQVSQLHIHIIGRSQKDTAWPKPAWGQKTQAYSQDESRRLILSLQKAMR